MGQHFEDRTTPLKAAADSPVPGNFLELKLDLCDADRVPLEDDEAVRVVRKVLTRASLFGSKFLYCAFAPALLETVKQLGTYRTNRDGSPKNKVFCNEVNGNVIMYRNETLVEAVVTRGDSIRGTGYFIVYDRDQLVPVESSAHGEFVFSRPTNRKAAVLAIVEVRF